MASLDGLKIELDKALYLKGIEDMATTLLAELILLKEDGLDHECPLSEVMKHIVVIQNDLKLRNK